MLCTTVCVIYQFSLIHLHEEQDSTKSFHESQWKALLNNLKWNQDSTPLQRCQTLIRKIFLAAGSRLKACSLDHLWKCYLLYFWVIPSHIHWFAPWLKYYENLEDWFDAKLTKVADWLTENICRYGKEKWSQRSFSKSYHTSSYSLT